MIEIIRRDKQVGFHTGTWEIIMPGYASGLNHFLRCCPQHKYLHLALHATTPPKWTPNTVSSLRTMIPAIRVSPLRRRCGQSELCYVGSTVDCVLGWVGSGGEVCEAVLSVRWSCCQSPLRSFLPLAYSFYQWRWEGDIVQNCLGILFIYFFNHSELL